MQSGADNPLTPRQARFVELYVAEPTLNGTKAAEEAGFSPRTAASQASRMLKNVKVAAAIEKAKAKRMQRVHFTQDEVLSELKGLTHSRIDHYRINQATGQLEVTENAPPNAMAAVQSFDVEPIVAGIDPRIVGYKGKIKLWDKPGTLKLAGRHIAVPGFFDKLEVTGKDGKDLVPATRGEAVDALRSVIPAAAAAVAQPPAPAANEAAK